MQSFPVITLTPLNGGKVDELEVKDVAIVVPVESSLQRDLVVNMPLEVPNHTNLSCYLVLMGM